MTSLDQITQHTAEMLNCPIVIFDLELKVAAFSRHEGEVDKGRLLTILGRKAPPRAIKAITNANLDSDTDAIIVPMTQGSGPRMLVPLRHKDVLQGYLSLVAEPESPEELLDSYKKSLASVTEEIASVLARIASNTNDALAIKQESLQLLLSESIEERKTAAKLILNQNLLPPSPVYTLILVTDLSKLQQNSFRGRSGFNSVDDAISQNNIPNSLRGVISGDGVIILPRKIHSAEVTEVLFQKLAKNLFIGISEPMSQLDSSNTALREARIAADFAIRQKLPTRVAEWTNMGIDRLLTQLPFERLLFTDLPDSLQRLLNFESGIDLVETLNCYLQSSGEVQETARKLNIHRSTLYYRLDKIKDLTKADLTDGETRRLLHTSLRIAELAGFWKRLHGDQ